MGYYPAQEILPGLWIGSKADSQNPEFMRKHNIGLVVNATKSIPFLSMPGVEHYRIPVDDATEENETMLSHWPVVVRAIDTVLQRGKGVLVHCHAGIQRSASTVAAYLMYKYNMPANTAIAAIKSRKPETFWPVPTFGSALKKYEKQLTTFNIVNNTCKRKADKNVNR
jgi:dual specificity phosphatase 12